MGNTGPLLCDDAHMDVQDPPPSGPPAAVFVCEPCGVRVEVDDPEHLPLVEALHRAACHPFETGG